MHSNRDGFLLFEEPEDDQLENNQSSEAIANYYEMDSSISRSNDSDDMENNSEFDLRNV